jgi:hypothetical protein
VRYASVAARIHSVEDAHYFGAKRLPKSLLRRYESGSGHALALHRNVELFAEVGFVPRSATFSPRKDLRRTVIYRCETQ